MLTHRANSAVFDLVRPSLQLRYNVLNPLEMRTNRDGMIWNVKRVKTPQHWALKMNEMNEHDIKIHKTIWLGVTISANIGWFTL